MANTQLNSRVKPSEDRSFFGHPRGLSTLFFTEFGERFGYYGMRALLILFMVAPKERGGLGFSDGTAGAIYGLYVATVYMMSLPGGWIADRFLGLRRTVFYGGILIAVGYAMLAIPNIAVFYTGLCVVILGTGMLKPNISAIVGQLYAQGDPRRDAGFSIFYMGINLGAMIGPLVCGYVGEKVNWHWGLGLAGAGMAVGIIFYWMDQKRLGEAGLHIEPAPSPEARRKEVATLRNGILGIVGTAAFLLAIHITGIFPLTAEFLVNAAGIALLVLVVALFGWLFFGGDWTPVERKRLMVIGVLFLASALFWSAFEQAGSTLNLFAERETDRTWIGGGEFPASWFQSMNSFFIITFAGILAWLWIKLGDKQPSSPAKFSLGLLLVGAGFVVLALGAVQAAGGVKVSPMYLTVTYLLHTIGELCLSPVGLSAMTKLAPARVAGLMMGIWFISISVGNYIGGRLASFYGDIPLPNLFGLVAGITLVAGVILALVAKPVERLSGGIK